MTKTQQVQLLSFLFHSFRDNNHRLKWNDKSSSIKKKMFSAQNPLVTSQRADVWKWCSSYLAKKRAKDGLFSVLENSLTG